MSIPDTVPVKVGDAKGAFNASAVVALLISEVKSLVFAFKFNAVCVAAEIGLLASEVLSTLPKPTIVLSIPDTVPVKVGDAKGAFNASAVVALLISKVKSLVFAFKFNAV